MTIVQVPRRFVRSHWGGTETVILETSRRLLANGHRTEILCPDALADNRDEMVEGVHVRRFPYFYPYIGLRPDARRLLDFRGGNLFSPALLGALLRYPGLDLIHLHTQLRLGGIARTAARLRGIPYVVSLHGGLFDAPAAMQADYVAPTRGTLEWGKALGWMVGSRRVIDDADVVFVLGRREEAEVRRRHPRPRVVYLPNGVEADRFQTGDGAGFRRQLGLAAGDQVLLCVGRIDPQKGQVQAVRALASLLPTHPRARLVLAGGVTNEPYAEALSREVAERGLTAQVRIVPGIPPAAIPDAYHAADAFMLPSAHEPFGIVILEAWASGLPVVAHRVGGVPDFVRDGEDGLLVQPDDPEGLVRGLARVLDSRDEARRLAAAGLARARNEFSWDAIARRLATVYEETLRGHAGGRRGGR